MLQFIRDKSQGWIAWIIIGTICLIFALWGVRSYLYSAQAENVVAKVNGVKITADQLNNAYSLMKRQAAMQKQTALTSDESQQLKAVALQGLINNIVEQQNAVKSGFQVAPDLVSAAIAKMPVFQENGEFSEARFQQFLSGMMYSPDQFYQQVADQILGNQVQFGMIGTSFVLPNELNEAAALIHQTRSFEYGTIAANRFLAQVKVSDQQIKQYYQTNQAQFSLPAKISLNYLELSVKDLMNKIHPTEDQVKSFYQNNIATYTHPKEWEMARILISVPYPASSSDKAAAKKKIDAIVKRLQSGTSFETLAKSYSDDKLTASKGGVMPFQNRAQFANEVQSVLGSLNKVGDISTPIYVSGEGYLLLQVLAIKPEVIQPFSAVQNKVEEMYRQQKAEQQFADMSDQLSNLTYESPNSLEPAAKKLGLTIQSTEVFTEQGGTATFTKNPRIIQEAFSDEVTNQKLNSDPVNLSDDDVVVLRAKQYVEEQVKPLPEVKAAIKQTLEQQGAAALAKQTGDEALQQLQSGQSLPTIAAKYNVDWHAAHHINRTSRSVPSEILFQAFQLAVPSDKGKVVYGGNSLANGDYALIALTNMTPSSMSAIPESQQKAFDSAAASSYGQLEYLLYQNGLLNDAHIARYPQQ